MFKETKLCKCCGQTKSILDFRYRKHRGEYRHTSQCMQCEKDYRDRTKEVRNAKVREYYLKNKEEISRKKKSYRDNNKEKYSLQYKNYYKKNREKIALRQKKYATENRLKRNEYFKKYSKGDKRKNYQREYTKKRRATDPGFNLKYKLSIRLSECINRSDNTKSISLLSVLGCPVEELKTRLGINGSYDGNKYHIDHIIPCKLYDFTDDKEVKKCFNYRNLRLIPAKENLSKKDFLDLNLVESLGLTDLLPST